MVLLAWNKAYIEEENLYLYREENVILGAMAVTMYQEEDYHAIEWSKQVDFILQI